MDTPKKKNPALKLWPGKAKTLKKKVFNCYDALLNVSFSLIL